MNKIHALIADDYSNMRMLLATMLRQMNISSIEEVVDGEAAVAAHAERGHDLIFLDINMPRKSGLDALEEIMTNNPNAYVVMQTGERDAVTIKSAIERGARGYIVKPYNFLSIKEAVERFVALTRTT